MEAEIGKEKIKIPFNAYDLFGYLIPGTVALVSIYLFEFLVNTEQVSGKYNIPFYSTLHAIGNSVAEKKDWALSISFMILVLMVMYVVGHIVSSMSSFCLDRVLINKGSGYPYLRLFKIESPEREKNWESGPFYRGSFFWINLYLLLRYFVSIDGDPVLHSTVNYVGWFMLFMLALKIIVGHFRRYPWKWIFNKSKAGMKKYGRLFLKGLFCILWSGPYDLITRSLSHYVNTRNPLSPEMITSYKRSFKEVFNMQPEQAEGDNYWMCTCYLADKSPSLNSMVVNWFHMYSYARNIASAFYVAYLYCYLAILCQKDFILAIHNKNILIMPVVFLILSLIMQSRFYYLYFSYYSKFLFRSFIYLNKVKSGAPEPRGA